MFHILFSLLRAKYIFFWFYQSVGFEAKDVLVECDYVISREMNTVLKIAVFGKGFEMLIHGKCYTRFPFLSFMNKMLLYITDVAFF